MAQPRKVHSDLLDTLLGPVDPVEYERVRKEMTQQRCIVNIRMHYGWYAAMFASLIRSNWLLTKIKTWPAYTIESNGRVDLAVTHNVQSLLSTKNEIIR